MGCANSKVDNEEGVARCKQRKKLMKQTVTSRNNFAAAHAQFLMSLKGIGSAFRQFAEGEVKDGEHHHYPDTPPTPRTPTLSLGPPPSVLPPPPPMSPVFSPSPPHSPPTTKMSALRLQRGSASSPESVSMDFLPPPPPPLIVKQQHRMEHTPPVVPTKIFRFEDSSNSSSSSYMAKPYRMEDSAPPPLIQPVQIDDDWLYSGQTTNPQLSHAARESNPPPPPPVTRSSWQDLFMDPFRPSPPTFNYMEQRRNQEGEAKQSEEQERKLQDPEQKRNHDEEQRRIHEMEQRRSREVEQRRIHEMEQRRAHELEHRRSQEMEQRTPPKQAREKSPDRPPPVKTQQEARKQEADLDIPELEDIEDVPDLEDVDEDVDGPPPKDSDDEKDNKKQAKQAQPEPETPPKTPPKTPQKVHEKPPKAAKIPTPGKPPKPEQREEAMARVNKELAVVRAEKGGRDLLDVLKEVDDCFMKAAESGENVSRMLETKKAHYHSSFSVLGESGRMNFWKKSGKSGSPGANHYRTGSNMSVVAEESASIMSMRATSNMNLSMRTISNMSSQRWSEECGLTGSHASTLDRLFAWEKKLYLEVKGAEALRVDLERKYALFRNQDAKNEDQTVIEKTRSTIKALQTRMVVAIEAVDSAATQVQKLRDEELYPQLLELLEGMGAMWREMSMCHQAQLKAVEAIRRLDNSAACEPTTSSHRHSTQQLEIGLNKWSESLSRAVHSQRDYLKSLTLWLRLSLMQFGSDEAPDTRSGSRSPSRSPNTLSSSPIYGLCSKWLDSLDQLADRVVLEAIGSFAAVVREMLRLQWEELRIKKRVETYHRELEKREHALASAAMRDPGSVPHHMPQTPSTTSGSDMDERSYDSRYDGRYEGRYDIVSHRDTYSERTEVVDKRNKMEASRRKLEDEIQAERKAYTDTRAYTLNSLQAGLPQLFQAILSFSNQETDVYEKLSGAGTPLRGRH